MAGELITIERPDDTEITRASSRLERMAAALTVTDSESHQKAQELLIDIARGVKIVQALAKVPKDLAFKHHRALTKWENDLLLPYEKARALVDAKKIGYEQAERRRAAEEAAIRQEQARRLEEEKQINDAVAAEAAGDAALAESILEERVDVPTVVPVADVAKVKGVSTRKTYTCEVVSKRLYCEAAVERHQYELIDPNMKSLNKLASALKESFSFPGVRLVVTESSSVRTD